MTSALELTGERTVPGLPRENYWFRRHEVAYQWLARDFGPDLAGLVVDAGSGEGYGAALLAEAQARPDPEPGRPAKVVALEYDEVAAEHSRRTYPQVTTVRANLAALPLPSGTVSAVITMQVIEHLWDLGGFLADCRRCLRPGGLLVAATPNRLTFSPGLGRGQKPTNPFHVEEFDAAQLSALAAAAGFAESEVFGVWHSARLRGWEDDHGSIVAAQIRAVLDDDWPTDLAERVAAVDASDFSIGRATQSRPIDTALDLILVARTPR